MVNLIMKSMTPAPRFFLAAFSLLFAGLFFSSASLNNMEPQPELAIGAKAPMSDVLLQNIDGTFLSLEGAAGKNGLLVVFSCNTCPFVIGNGTKSDGWEGRYNETAAKAEAYGFNMMLINSNEAKRDHHDSVEAMRTHAKEQGYTMPYLVDTDHTIADAFGALKTPHVFLFNNKMELVYRGSIDDNVSNAAAVESFYVLDAMAEASIGKPCSVPETKAMGCSIKRVR